MIEILDCPKIEKYKKYFDLIDNRVCIFTYRTRPNPQ